MNSLARGAIKICVGAKAGSRYVNSEWWNEKVMQRVNRKKAWLNLIKVNDDLDRKRNGIIKGEKFQMEKEK